MIICHTLVNAVNKQVATPPVVVLRAGQQPIAYSGHRHSALSLLKALFIFSLWRAEVLVDTVVLPERPLTLHLAEVLHGATPLAGPV